VLEHVADPDVLDLETVEQDLTAVPRHQPRHQVDQGALAAAVRAEHGYDPAARDVEVEPVVDHHLVEALGQPANGDVRARRCGRGPRGCDFERGGHAAAQ